MRIDRALHSIGEGFVCSIEYERPFRNAIVMHDLKKKGNIDIVQQHLSRLGPQDACIIDMDYRHPPDILAKPSRDLAPIFGERLADQFAKEQANSEERLVFVRATIWIAGQSMILPTTFPLRTIVGIVNDPSELE
jgi:hypothetical protein